MPRNRGSELDGTDPRLLPGHMFQPEVRQILGAASHHPRAAVVIPKGLTAGMPQVLRGGDECWSYRLTPPVGLKLRPKPGDPNFTTVSDRCPKEGNNGHRLEELLATHWTKCRGAAVHWAACRVVHQR